MLGNGKTYESILNDLGNSKKTWLELLQYNNVHPILVAKTGLFITKRS